jgi:uncharacterized protein (TIGR02117 family)
LVLKSNISSDKKTKTIYLLYDEMHSDIVINIEDYRYNWQKFFPELVKNRKKGYLAFGWGDRETYLNTPSWSDLKITVALKALFINTPSLMHVTYYQEVERFLYLKPIKVSKTQKDEIERRILNSFGDEIVFRERGYDNNSRFYNSPYRYNLINTCNTWSGDILRESNVTMSYWTPFSFNVVDSLLLD